MLKAREYVIKVVGLLRFALELLALLDGFKMQQDVNASSL